MGSVIDYIECPNCKCEAYDDFYYKTGEQYINCNNCGYHYSATIINRDKNLNELTDELKTVFILSFDMKHFEVIGKLLQNNRIQREFTVNDSIFLKIQQMVTTNNNS